MLPLSRRFVLTILPAAVAFPGIPGANSAPPPCCGAITPAGQRLAMVLDGSHVQQGWENGWHVNWLTGLSDRPAPGGKEAATHCSAYAAAIAERVGIYLLRPPEHAQELLANAQMRWLREHGSARGWQGVSYLDAQGGANAGALALAVFEAPDPHRPGHVAVVRPSLKSRAAIDRDGPQIAMAGTINYASTTMAHGFRFHHGAWKPDGRGAAQFYTHFIDRSLAS